jgi:class 3 adenylate cyclase
MTVSGLPTSARPLSIQKSYDVFIPSDDLTPRPVRLLRGEDRLFKRAFQAPCRHGSTRNVGGEPLIYFGFPAAHEGDTARAVHTGLGIVEAIGTLNTRLEDDYSVELAVRIGIHTGPVVVGEMDGGERHENLALGETPNIAARSFTYKEGRHEISKIG